MTTTESNKMIAEGDLVMIRLQNNGIGHYYNTWVRVKFIDLDDSITCIIERVHYLFNMHSIGDAIPIAPEQVLRTYNEGEEFCYDDNVTICSCPGVCRNKM